MADKDGIRISQKMVQRLCPLRPVWKDTFGLELCWLILIGTYMVYVYFLWDRVHARLSHERLMDLSRVKYISEG